MKRSEITLLSVLTLVGTLMGTLPSWPTARAPTIVRIEPADLEHTSHRVEDFAPRPTGYRETSAKRRFVAAASMYADVSWWYRPAFPTEL